MTFKEKRGFNLLLLISFQSSGLTPLPDICVGQRLVPKSVPAWAGQSQQVSHKHWEQSRGKTASQDGSLLTAGPQCCSAVSADLPESHPGRQAHKCARLSGVAAWPLWCLFLYKRLLRFVDLDKSPDQCPMTSVVTTKPCAVFPFPVLLVWSLANPIYEIDEIMGILIWRWKDLPFKAWLGDVKMERWACLNLYPGVTAWGLYLNAQME